MKQNSYVKISNDLHPQWESFKMFYSNLNIPDELDFKIVDEILKFNKEIGSIDMGGAWRFYNENTRKDYTTALHNGDRDVLANLFSSLFQNECSSAIITPSINKVKDFNLSNQMCWDLDALAEFSNLEYDYPILNASNVGAPFGIEVNGNKILPDSARHLFFAEKVKHLAEKKNQNILEIGGGYGGLAYFLNKLNFKNTYFNIDLPETLFICYYYLRKNKINCEFLTNVKKIKKGVFYLIPSIDYEKIVRNIEFGVFFNSASLSEMDKKIAFNYIEMINKKQPKYILHCNSNYLAFPNSKIHIEILAKNFPINKKSYELVYKYISPFQGASGRYRIFLYKSKQTR